MYKRQDYIPYTPQNEEEYFQQLEQWNDEDEYTRCIQALNAIPEDWRNYRIAYALSLIHISSCRAGKAGAFAAHSGRVGLPVRRRMSDPVPMGRWVRLLHASTLV